MVNGEIYTGSHGYAGEVAIYKYKEEEVFNCKAARGCFLKRNEIDLGIVEEVKEILSKDKEEAKSFFKLTSSSMDNLDLKSVFIASRTKNNIATTALNSAAKRLGIKIAYLVNLLNPQVVVIGGGLEEAGDDFLNKVNQTVRDWAFRETTDDLKIVYSQLRENAVSLGAASLVIEKVFAQL
jgi:glucokinase